MAELFRDDDMDQNLGAVKRKRGWLSALIFLLPVVIYLPGIMGKVPYISQSALYTDLLITHYSNAVFLKKSILDFNQIPLWSTLIHSGAPFAANPLSGLFYLPGWLALLFPLPGGISISLAAHIVFGSWGMYRFMRSEGVGPNSAVAGGLIFGLMPKIAAHYGAGHVSLIYAISWTPWLFFISKEDQSGWKTGIVAAMLFLADPRWAFYAGIFWFSFDLWHRIIKKVPGAASFYLKSGITGLLIAAPLIIPFFEYIRLSTRSEMGIEDILAFSMPPEKILGLLIPTGSNPEWYIYSGGVVLGLFFLQALFKDSRKTNRFWNIWLGIAFVISMGSSLINPAWLDQIPLISLLRVPSRIIFLTGFCFAVISAKTIEGLEFKNYKTGGLQKTAFGLGLFSLGMGTAAAWILGELNVKIIWGFSFLAIFALILIVYTIKPVIKARMVLLMAILLLDLIGAGLQGYSLKISDSSEVNGNMGLITADHDLFRVYSPSYSLPQYIAAEQGIEIADGVDPMQISDYAEFMADASGVDAGGYSVTIPSFSTGDPSIDNQAAVPDPFLLGLLNVKYVISNYMIEHKELQEISSTDDNFLYRNAYPFSRAWVERQSRNRGTDMTSALQPVDAISLTPNRIEIQAQGPGTLVLSEINYPGWVVTVDGNRSSITNAYGLLRSVPLDEGKHEIQFDFKPLSVYAGIAMAFIGWILAASQIIKIKR